MINSLSELTLSCVRVDDDHSCDGHFLSPTRECLHWNLIPDSGCRKQQTQTPSRWGSLDFLLPCDWVWVTLCLKGRSVKVFWCCDVHFVFLLGMSLPGAGTGLVFVRMRLIWFLFSLASHCEIIPTVASEPRSLSLASAVFRENVKFYHLFLFSIISKINQGMLKGSEHLSQIPSKMFSVLVFNSWVPFYGKIYALYLIFI